MYALLIDGFCHIMIFVAIPDVHGEVTGSAPATTPTPSLDHTISPGASASSSASAGGNANQAQSGGERMRRESVGHVLVMLLVVGMVSVGMAW